MHIYMRYKLEAASTENLSHKSLIKCIWFGEPDKSLLIYNPGLPFSQSCVQSVGTSTYSGVLIIHYKARGKYIHSSPKEVHMKTTLIF